MVSSTIIIEQFSQAVSRLEESLRRPKDSFMRDSSIQRFEFTFDVAWKALKSYLEDQLKVRCASPRACLREAYAQKLIPYEIHWLKMADDRNLTAHMYKESVADEVYVRLPAHLKLFQSLVEKLRAKPAT